MTISSQACSKVSQLIAIAIFAGLCGASAAHADTNYAINTTITSANPTGNPLQSDSVVGSITTDGTIGVLQASDILSWNLELIDNLNSAYDYDLTNSNSSLVEDYGDALTASADGLSFNYSGAGEFLIQGNLYGAYSGYEYFCFSTGGACLAGETIAPYEIYVDGAVLTGSSEPIGNQPLGGESATPEPSTLLLMGTGVAGLVEMARRRVGSRAPLGLSIN